MGVGHVRTRSHSRGNGRSIDWYAWKRSEVWCKCKPPKQGRRPGHNFTRGTEVVRRSRSRVCSQRPSVGALIPSLDFFYCNKKIFHKKKKKKKKKKKGKKKKKKKS